ncbi:MAG: MATE family efflux transporter [Peptoniphilus sp.]|nr:MATE family efflux transporter [Peptoniphilus sp.]MDY3119105.1 MATE family efflux transporter [Peptoniphilus sp.]
MKNNILDATNGPILKPLIAFSVPIMLANILQLLFNAADIVVIGQFVDETAVAAVGSTGFIINILVSLFTGLSIGATVVMSTELGSGNTKLHKVIHTTYTLGVILGIFTAIVGLFISPFLLELLGTPEDIIGQANTYLKIFFLGQPGFMIYTFARAILVAKGDTKSPFRYLLFSGIVNVALNVFLVTVVHLGVAGVAIATIVSQYLSAILTVRKLTKTHGVFHLKPTEFSMDRGELKKIVRLGLPTGLQSTLISVSGLLTQSSFNSLGTAVVAGQSASGNIMAFVALSLNAFSQGCMTFTGQNFGSKQMDRVKRTYRCTLLINGLLGLVLGTAVIVFGESLLRIYTPNSEASVMAGKIGLIATMAFAPLMGLQDASGFVLRGMNQSAFPTITALFGNCVFRIFWVIAVFNRFAPNMETLRACRLLVSAYPISWVLIMGANTVAYLLFMKKYTKN